ncbi:MAG: hypothetical protein IKN65_00280 [Clostridia bacterium]|nr:hypothetical protein [Bacilli bacterium]MBR3672720.1 hypothetical protein [Clostridia bacterium]MBR4671594.1 hypothetical protein [Bacilli bacterium]
MEHNKKEDKIETYHYDKLTDFNVFCNAHWNYKTRNLKFNILRFSWNVLKRINKIYDFIHQFNSNINHKISNKLCKVYLNLAKPEICERDKDYIFEIYGYKK